MIIRRNTANRRTSRINSVRPFGPASVGGLEFYFRADNSTVDASTNLLISMPDLTNHGYNISVQSGLGSGYNAISEKFIHSTVETHWSLTSTLKTAKPMEPPFGKKMVIYVVGDFYHKPDDAYLITKSLLLSVGAGTGWQVLSQKLTTSLERFMTYERDGTGAQILSPGSSTDRLPHVGQVYRFDIDYTGGAGVNTFGSEVNKEPRTTATCVGYSPYGSPVLLARSGTAGINGQIAAIFGYYVNDDIGQSNHDKLVDWCWREFFYDFDISDVPGMEFYVRGDRGLTLDASNQVTALGDQSGLGHNLTPNGSGNFVWNPSSQHLSIPTISTQGNITTANLRGTGFSPTSGQKRTVYVVATPTIPESDSAGTQRHLARLAAVNVESFLTVKGATSSDHYLKVSLRDGSSALVDATGTHGEVKTSTAQVYRFETDGDGNNHLLSVDKNPPTTWSSAGYTPNANVFDMGLGANLEVAAIFAFVNPSSAPIDEATHEKIVDWANREFIKPFIPSDVPGLRMDLNGDKGITLATGVTNWADQSGYAHNAAQATTNLQPAYTSENPLENRHGTVDSDGAFSPNADYMVIPSSPDFDLGAGFSIYFAGTLQDNGGANRYLAARWSGSVPDRLFAVYLSTAGKLTAWVRDAADTVFYVVTSTNVVADGKFHRIRVGWDGSQLSLDVDSDSRVSTSAPTINSAPATTRDITINGRAQTDSAAMSTSRWFWYNRFPNDLENYKIMDYLRKEYAPRAFSDGFSTGLQNKKQL